MLSLRIKDRTGMSLAGQLRVAVGCSIVRVGAELRLLIAAVEANQIKAESPTYNLTGLKHANMRGFMCGEVRCWMYVLHNYSTGPHSYSILLGPICYSDKNDIRSSMITDVTII